MYLMSDRNQEKPFGGYTRPTKDQTDDKKGIFLVLACAVSRIIPDSTEGARTLRDVIDRDGAQPDLRGAELRLGH